MPQVNLLPWREELRAQRNKEFGILAGVMVAIMGAAVFGVHTYYQGRVDFQNKRNEFVQSQIALLDEKIKEIKTLEKERDRLIKRKEKIEELQSGRPEIVHLMDELVATLPEGVYYTSIQQKGDKLATEGVAQSNARVSSLMRKVDASEWVESPALLEIIADKKQGADLVKLSNFKLNFQQKKKKKKEDEGDGDS